MIIRLTLIAIAASTVASAGPQGVRPVPESRTTRSLTAVEVAGQTYLAVRDMLVDLDFPDGRVGKGRLGIVFEPLSGFYLQDLAWEGDRYPIYSAFYQAEANSRVGIGSDRLFIVTFVRGLVVQDSAEKATSIDDAEAKALKSYADHLAEVEGRTYRGQVNAKVFGLFQEAFPKGFFLSELSPGVMDPHGLYTVRLADMVRNDDGDWVLTLENVEDPKVRPRTKVVLRRIRDQWSVSNGFPLPDGQR